MKITFSQLGIDQALVNCLQQQGITEPTAIQEETIPLLMEGKDVLGQSETGTGKTLAYLLPIMQKIDTLKRETQAMILAPTHELAIQIQREIDKLARDSGLAITSAAIIGNVNIARQVEKLKQKPHILVGSSGRILELIQKKKIVAQTVRTIVLDEADRLLDEHNIAPVKAVIKTTLSRTQLVLFSATISPITYQKASELLKQPEVVRVTDKISIPPTVEHVYFEADQRDKIELLRKLIRLILPIRALIFINKSEEITKVVEKLNFHGLEAEGIYGGAYKSERKKAIDDFRRGKSTLLVSSDLAARGLDLKGISHIFNLDLPEDPQLYLHRVGRTGRAGQSGVAVSIVTGQEVPLIKKLENSFAIKIKAKEMAFGKIFDVTGKSRPGKR